MFVYKVYNIRYFFFFLKKKPPRKYFYLFRLFNIIFLDFDVIRFLSVLF